MRTGTPTSTICSAVEACPCSNPSIACGTTSKTIQEEVVIRGPGLSKPRVRRPIPSLIEVAGLTQRSPSPQTQAESGSSPCQPSPAINSFCGRVSDDFCTPRSRQTPVALILLASDLEVLAVARGDGLFLSRRAGHMDPIAPHPQRVQLSHRTY